MKSKDLTHLDNKGHARMVDVGHKAPTPREARAFAQIFVGKELIRLIKDKKVPKGDVFCAARIAGILAAKKVDQIIPLCHPLPLHFVEIEFDMDDDKGLIEIRSTVKVHGKTGVEMEALTAVSTAALTIYDMCKSVEKGIIIKEIRLEYKSGGKSGCWKRSNSLS